MPIAGALATFAVNAVGAVALVVVGAGRPITVVVAASSAIAGPNARALIVGVATGGDIATGAIGRARVGIRAARTGAGTCTVAAVAVATVTAGALVTLRTPIAIAPGVAGTATIASRGARTVIVGVDSRRHPATGTVVTGPRVAAVTAAAGGGAGTAAAVAIDAIPGDALVVSRTGTALRFIPARTASIA